MEKIEEQKLIEECQRGNLEKFGEIYDFYAPAIYRFIYFRTRHKELAQDLTAQTFLKALEKIDSFKFNQGQFSSWLYRIAKNLIIDYWRAKKTELNVDDFWSLNSGEDISQDAQAKERVEKIRKMLNKLSLVQKEIITLRIWDELSWREIAEILDKTEASCKMNFMRTLDGFKNEEILAIILIFTFSFGKLL